LESAFGGAFFSFPVGVRHASDGSDRKFIIERDGRIQVVDADGNVGALPFLDISDEVDTAFEGGFLGLAFHPDYANNGRFFVKYTFDGDPAFGSQLITRVSEFTVDAFDPDVADPSSERIIIEIPQDSNNHNGGDLHFGPDGYLYFGMGDGGGSNDPCNRGQTLDPDDLLVCGNHATTPAKVLLGKMVRIDIDATTPAGSNNLCAADADGSAAYAVPESNPYADEADRCGEVWAYGKRNPYRFSFDRDNGDLWIGDVGQGTWEEINREPAGDPGGRNYGWKICEGDWLRGSTTSACTLLGHAGPTIEYRRTSPECSVTGGYRYRGPITSMQGRYVFGDYCSGRIWFAEETSPDTWTREEFGLVGGAFQLVGFGEDEVGNLYVSRVNGQILVFTGDTDLGDQVFEDRFELPDPGSRPD
jgi:glucose/arabinose dehydrogenase